MTTQSAELFTRDEWFKLPLVVRQRWWRETEFGKLEPSPELLAQMNDVLQRPVV